MTGMATWWAITLACAKTVERLVNLWVNPSQVRSIQVARHEETKQIPHEFCAEISLRDVGLYQRPYLTEQPCSRTPTHQ